jgi:hypothetical protein
MLHNYFRWHLVTTYIDDLSYNYIHAHREFLDNYNEEKLHLTNEEYCTREIIRKFPLAMQRLYTMNSTRYSDTTLTVRWYYCLLKLRKQFYLDSNDF